MKFSYNWLKELVNFKESPEKLAELLNIRSFEVEGVEKIGRDFALDAKIPTNRISDAGNHWGLAREIAAILGKESRIKDQESKPKIHGQAAVKIKIAKPELCPRYVAQTLEIKKIIPSPKWLRERLIVCGLRPIGAVVDITNYVMLETGQPLHAFDLDKIQGAKMTIGESKKGEELTTLDGTKHILPQGAIIIEDAKRIIDLAGIMGGENSAVSHATKRILLQAAVFDPVRIYKTSRALKFSTAAAKIYSSGIDPSQASLGLERAAELLEKIDGAKRMGPVTDIYPQKTQPVNILFRTEHVNRIIGQEFAPIFYKTIFERLGFMVEKKDEDLIVEVPTIRRDIQIEEDLIEEATRMYGYDKILPTLPETTIKPAARNLETWWEERIRDFLAGTGFNESRLYEFTGGEELEKFAVEQKGLLELENPMNPETKYLVPRTLIKYIASAADNLRNFDEVRIFGVGKSFLERGGKADEQKDLAIVLAQKNTSGEEEFYRMKGVVDELLEKMGISDHWYDDKVNRRLTTNNLRLFHPYRNAEIKIGDEKIGNIGEIHPAVAENIKAKARIVAAEIDFEKLVQAATSESEYRPVGKYPAIIRDLAVVVPSDTKTESVLNIVENTGGKLLADTDLFDYFQDGRMRESEEKSLAFHLIFQSSERTLKDEEINKLVEKIIKALEQKGWGVRK